MIASRTPEGYSGRCPVCSQDVVVEPSDALSDAPCPACGTLLWPIGVGMEWRLVYADQFPESVREALLRAVLAFGSSDSLDFVEAVMELEDSLDVDIPDNAAKEWTTLSDFLDWLARRK